MRAVLQRVNSASVVVDGKVISSIGKGVLCYVSYSATETEATMGWMANKIAGLRIFPDNNGNDRFDRSVNEIDDEVLIVSNFTLHADSRKGRRPDFIGAASPTVALPLHNRFLEIIKESGVRVQDGQFGAHMMVESVNDGPVTLILERD